MTWTRLDENFAEEAVWETAGPGAMFLHVAALGYCNRHSTDGVLSRSRALRLLPWAGIDYGAAVDALVEHGLWTETADAQIHIVDFLKHQPSREDVEKRRAANTERQRVFRAKREAERHAVTSAVTKGVSQADVTTLVIDPRPDPSRPLGRDGGGEGANGKQSGRPSGADAPPTAPPGRLSQPQITVKVRSHDG